MPVVPLAVMSTLWMLALFRRTGPVEVHTPADTVQVQPGICGLLICTVLIIDGRPEITAAPTAPDNENTVKVFLDGSRGEAVADDPDDGGGAVVRGEGAAGRAGAVADAAAEKGQG